MKHDDQRVRRYLDNELSPAEARAFRTHIAECESCRQQLGALELLDARLRDLPRITPPLDFAAKVRTQIAHLPAPQRATHLLPMALGLATGGVLAVITTFESFVASASDLYDLLLRIQSWTLGFLNGQSTFGSLDLSYSSGAPITLVVGLTLICAACVLLLRQSLTSPIEV